MCEKESKSKGYKKKKYDIEYVYQLCNELGLICKSREYKTIKDNLVFTCTQCGEDFERNLDNLITRRSTICNLCGKRNGNRKVAFTLEEVKEFVNKNSECKLLSTSYYNYETPMEFKCKCGETFSTPFENFKLKNKRQCDNCGKEMIRFKNTTTEEILRKEVESIGYSYLGRYFKEEKKKDNHYLILQCNNNHPKYEVNLNKFRSGQRCPHCNVSKGEFKILEYLNRHNILYDREFKFEDLKGIGDSYLRFDFSIKGDELILIEYDGIQHFEIVEKFGGEDYYNRTVYHDNLKNEYCKNNGIKLIRIPYWNYSLIEEILSQELSCLIE